MVNQPEQVWPAAAIDNSPALQTQPYPNNPQPAPQPTYVPAQTPPQVPLQPQQPYVAPAQAYPSPTQAYVDGPANAQQPSVNFEQPYPAEHQPPPGDSQASGFQHAQATTTKKSSRGLVFLMGLLGVLVGAGLSVGALFIATNGFSFSGSVDAATLNIQPISEDSSLAEAVASKVTPSVVNIDVYTAPSTNPLDSLLGNNRNDSAGDEADSLSKTGLGSGVIISSSGYILTNGHVVSGGQQFLVNLGDKQLEAKLVGEDQSSDLAVLKVDATGLTPIEVGDSDQVNVGEWVMAVGSPFGLEKSVSTGIVSALYRSTAMQSSDGVRIYANMIQTDAAINPGNSGGALVDSEGKLVGINTLVQTTSGSNSGVGFALPSNYAINIAEQIMQGKPVQHPYLGVTLLSVTTSNASSLKTTATTGAYVESVVPGSPAEKAGLQVGDVITAVDDTNVTSSADLIIQIRTKEIDSVVKLTIKRGSATQTIEVTLGPTPLE
jgi:putative serine protease PepD